MWKRKRDAVRQAYRPERSRGAPPQRPWRAAVLVALCAGASASFLAAQRQQALPTGPMQEKAQTACLTCHTAQIIVQQRLDRGGWTRETDKMIRWGAPVAAEDREALIDYLTNHFGPTEPQEPRGELPEGPGRDKVRAACLACHGVAIIAQQHLERRRWSQSVERQIRWGARVASGDREAVIDYLVQHFGPPKEDKIEKPAPELAAGPACALVQPVCLECHDAGTIVEQRFDRRGWTRVVRKMIGFGAVVEPDEGEAIIGYLVKNYSPAVGQQGTEQSRSLKKPPQPKPAP